MRLQGKVAIVTGAARGIGLATAERFAREGARIVLVDRDKRGETPAAALRDRGHAAVFIECDVASRDQIEAVVAATADRFGTPDVLVNNAAVHQNVSLLDMTEAEFSRVMTVNVNAVFLFAQAVARGLVAARKGGSIINLSSVNSRLATPMATAYAASKGAVSAFTAAAAVALAEHDIRVNAVAPGTVATEMTGGLQTPDRMEMVLSRTPLGRLGQPEEIASVACFLASDDASYVTGQTLFVDGGRSVLSMTTTHRR